MGTAGMASRLPLWIWSVQSCTCRSPYSCFSADLYWWVRCPSQTEHHPQLHASGHDCLSCSNCLLPLWSLRLRCQGSWLLEYWADDRAGSEPLENCDDPTKTFDHKWFGFLENRVENTLKQSKELAAYYPRKHLFWKYPFFLLILFKTNKQKNDQ